MGVNGVFLALLITGCGYCLAAGRGPERAGALIFILASVLSHLAISPRGQRYLSVEVGVLAVDALAFAAFFILALKADRFWPIWACALTGVGALGHLARHTSQEVIPWAYAFVLGIWSYLILILLVIATWQVHRRDRMSEGSNS